MNDRIPGSSFDNPIWYGKWKIYIADTMNSPFDYEFVHDDYDGAEDAGDSRYGHAKSVEDAKSIIDDIDADGCKAMEGCTAPPGVCHAKELGCVPGERDPSHDRCLYSEKTEFSGYAEDKEMHQIDNDMAVNRVRLKWYTPNGDKLLGHMARVSNPKASEDDPSSKLIGYLLRNHHWSPFEMVNLCVEIHTERDISAQILRHSKEFRFQEFSTRYAEVEDLRWWTECRFQDPKNRQHSLTAEDVMDKVRNVDTELNRDTVDEDEVSNTVAYFDAVVNETRSRSLEAYRELLQRGVAKECARRILPIGLMPTVMYINSNLRGWIHYLAERTKPGVQKEHREIALAVEPHFAACFPDVWKAVLAYREEQGEREDKILHYNEIAKMFGEYCGFNGDWDAEWKERYPDSTLAEAIKFNLRPLDDGK